MKKFFTFFIVFFHFLYLYASPISTLSIGDIILILLFIFLVLKNVKKSEQRTLGNISYLGCFICFYIFLHYLFVLLFEVNTDTSGILFSMCRIILYYLTVSIFSKSYFDEAYGLKIYKRLAIASSLFLFIQIFFLAAFNKYIPGQIPGIKLLNEDLQMFNVQMISGDIGHRPRSFFSEPSYYAIYVLLYLGIDLLCLKKHDFKAIIIITLGLLASGSGTAIFLTVFIYAIYLFENFKKIKKKTIITFALFLIIILFSFPIYQKTSIYQTFYERTFVSKTSTEGRFGTYNDIFFNENDSTIVKIFGRSIKKIDMYIAGVPRVYYYFGYFGLIIISLVCFYYLFKLKGANRVSLILLIVLSFGTEMIFSYMILLYGSFLVAKDNCNYEEDKI